MQIIINILNSNQEIDDNIIVKSGEEHLLKAANLIVSEMMDFEELDPINECFCGIIQKYNKVIR